MFLTKEHKYSDENMITTILRILKYKPSLKEINICWEREQCPNHLEQEGFDIADGRPDALMVVEREIPCWCSVFQALRIEKGGGRGERYIRLVS